MNTVIRAIPAEARSVPFDRFAEERSDIELLHAISMELIGEQDSQALYGKIVDAAITITQSQYGTMQLLAPATGGAGLQLLCSRGLPPEALKFWQWVSPTAHSSCTLALRSRRRAVISDYEEWDEIAGTEDLLAFRRTGIRSAQTTPLVSRNGNLLGMISTHWRKPHQPSERDLRMLDILARQAADLLERTIAEEALRAREQELERMCAALRESEDLQKMLTGELSHRVKNMLATVQAIASQTLRHSPVPADFVAGFSGRIQSMSRVHSQLSTNEWKGTRLRDVVEDQMKLGPVDETQISASGPDIELDATAVPKLAMILHELGTNSLKYGSLSLPTGCVDILWQMEDRMLSLTWTERGGPAVSTPVRRGFGSRLIEASARGDGGDARMHPDSEGVRWEIAFPLPLTVLPTAAGSAAPAGLAKSAAQGDRRQTGSQLAGKRILVVEDEPLLALDITSQLEDAGAIIVGPASSPAAALDLIERYRLDAALLDANLDGAPVNDIAAAVAGKGIPFAFVSGYGQASLPANYSDAAFVSKPVDPAKLVQAACRLIAQRTA